MGQREQATKPITLRDYQLEIKQQVESAWAHETRSVMCQVPTGTGKSVIMAAIIKDFLSYPSSPVREVPENVSADTTNQVLVVSHRREINEQLYATVWSLGLDSELKKGAVRVESIQKLSRELIKAGGERYKDFNPALICIDEAHHATAKTYRLLWDRWPSAKVLGMTATPCRLKAEGFTDLFECLISSWQTSRFIHEHWLSNFEYVAVTMDSEMLRKVESLKRRGADGDFTAREMTTVMDDRASIGQLYHSYRQYVPGLKGIIYAINVEHGNHIAEYYRSQGESIVMISGKTPARERKRLVDEYRKGEIQILVSVDCFGEGFDCPEVEFIQLARPTLSLVKYLQQVGRGLRAHADKSKCVILDNVGLCYRFGVPDEDRDWLKMFLEGQGMYALDIANAQKGRRDDAHVHTEEAADVDDGHDKDMTVLHSSNEQQTENDNRYAIAEIFHEDEVRNGSKKRTVRRRYGLKYHGKVVEHAFYYKIERVGDFFILHEYNMYAPPSMHIDSLTGDTLSYSIKEIYEITSDGLAHYKEEYDEEIKWLDGVTGEHYNSKPEIVKVDWITFVGSDGLYTPRYYWSGGMAYFRKEDLKVHGSMFMAKSIKGNTYFMHRNMPDVLMEVLPRSTDQVLYLKPRSEALLKKLGRFKYTNNTLSRL